EGPRPFRTPRVLADGDRVGELQTPFLQSLEDDVGGHELGEARRLHAVIRVALRNHLPAEVVHQDVGVSVDIRRLRDRRSEAGGGGGWLGSWSWGRGVRRGEHRSDEQKHEAGRTKHPRRSPGKNMPPILTQCTSPLFDALRTVARAVRSVTFAMTATSSAGSTGLLTCV